MNDFVFDIPLEEGVILKRSSMYTMAVEVAGVTTVCHCPTTGRIGNLDVAGLPCLLSRAKDPARKTKYTVEAVGLHVPGTSPERWIGINQNAVNRYVEHYLRNGGFADMVGSCDSVRREVLLGESKLDFLVGDTYLEVKTPLQTLQVDVPPHVRTKKTTPFSSTDRMVRHIRQLADSLDEHKRAVMLIAFVYDNPGFRIIEPSTNSAEVSRAVSECVDKGVETWQANFSIDRERVRLEKFFPVVIDVPEP